MLLFLQTSNKIVINAGFFFAAFNCLIKSVETGNENDRNISVKICVCVCVYAFLYKLKNNYKLFY